MQHAAPSEPPHQLLQRVLLRAGGLLFWTGVLVLGSFGIYFSFTNYPVFGVCVLVLILLLVGYSERQRRAKREAREAARSRARARERELPGD
jgi:uncharacterized membrane protein